MGLTKFIKDIAYISKLPNRPNRISGYTPEELKETFDNAGKDIQDWINDNFIPELDVAIANAAAGHSGQITTDGIADGAITAAKIADGAITAAKIADGAITDDALSNGAVTEDKISGGAVTRNKLADSSVDGNKLANGSVGSQHLINTAGSEAVTTNTIRDYAVTSAKIAANAVSTVYTATLNTTWTGSSAPYSKAQTVNGILATDSPIIDLVPSATYADAEAQEEAWLNVYRVVASANTLTFYAKEKPTVSLPIHVLCVRR